MPVADHHWACDWHLDQYDDECCCGATNPRHPCMDKYPPWPPPWPKTATPAPEGSNP